MWIPFAVASTVLNVAGQLLIKKSGGTPMQITCGIAVSAGVLGLLGLLFMHNSSDLHINIDICSILTGICFFSANLFWIYAIQRSTNISLVRAIMGAVEITLLAVLAYFIYHQTLTIKQIIGLVLVMIGVACMI
jgi:drug/metabolite transporter (DMT)-like permease